MSRNKLKKVTIITKGQWTIFSDDIKVGDKFQGNVVV